MVLDHLVVGMGYHYASGEQVCGEGVGGGGVYDAVSLRNILRN